VGEAVSAAEDPPPLAVDVISDVVCPWCFIGKRRLEKAIAEAGIALSISWRPYQLDPTIPPEGKDRRAYMEAKFGSAERIKEVHARVAAAGEGEGIPFAFDKIKVSPNTLDAHRLVRWAGEAGRQGEVVEALFRAYFIEGRNVGDAAVLADIASVCGLNRDKIAARLASEEDREAVRDEIESAQRIGVTGVPTFILAGRYGLVGAQPASELVSALKAIAARREAQAAAE
jgi:predicted DsbA family dithiol-disulfide isomerase